MAEVPSSVSVVVDDDGGNSSLVGAASSADARKATSVETFESSGGKPLGVGSLHGGYAGDVSVAVTDIDSYRKPRLKSGA